MTFKFWLPQQGEHKMKKFIGPLLVLSTLATPLAVSANSGSISPRDWKTNSIPGDIAQFLTELTDSVEFGTAASEMQAEGIEESVIVATVGLDGAIYNMSRTNNMSHRSQGSARYAKVHDKYESIFIPFKVSVATDGSYEVRVAAYRYRDNATGDFDNFYGWITIDDFTLFEKVKKEDKTRGLVDGHINTANLDISIGIYQTSNKKHNFLTTLGATLIKGGEYDLLTEDGYVYDMSEGYGQEYRAGLRYDYNNDGTKIKLEAGYKVKTMKSVAQTEYDLQNYEDQTAFYNQAYDEYLTADEAFEAAMEAYRVDRGLNYISEDTYYMNTGNERPYFDVPEPVQYVTDLTHKKSTVYAEAQYSKWLSRKKVKLTVTASGEYNLTNEITGFETDTTGADKYKAGLNFRVDY